MTQPSLPFAADDRPLPRPTVPGRCRFCTGRLERLFTGHARCVDCHAGYIVEG